MLLGILSLPTAITAESVTVPLAPVAPVTERHFGVTVVDRYRYLEDARDPRTIAFFRAQATYATTRLAAIGPLRTAFGRRIASLDRSSTSVGSIVRVGDRYFYERQDPHDETPRLFMRDATSTAEPHLLVDPTRQVARSEHGRRTHATIDWFVPSLDGRRVVYGISTGGSEASILHIVTTEGRDYAETIDRARFGATGWLPDGSGFFYIRLPRTTEATPVTEREQRMRCYIHRLGENPRNDRAVFGWQVDSRIPFAPDDIPQLQVTAGSPYVIATIAHGVKNEVTLYAEPLSALSTDHPAWVKVADVADAVTAYDVRDTTIYLLSHRGASTFRLIATDLRHPDLAQAREIIRPGHAVLAQIGVAADALYTRLLDGGIGRLSRIPFDAESLDASTRILPLPSEGSLLGPITDPRVVGATIGLTGWTRSLLWYQTDGHRLVDTRLKRRSPIDTSAYTSIETFARSADGTSIPLSIVFKRGMPLDGSHPTYLEGYGAYGVTLDPYFSTTRMAWLERGGIYAVAHVRGGGEYGEGWHRAAMRTEKMRSIEDYLACARYLIAHGYTSPRHLGGEGTSAGGIVIGGAITRAPQLFGAALDVVGVSDALRSEFSANGPGNTPEFGSVRNAQEFRTLLAIDAYQQVRDHTAYPAVLLITGINDPRVPSWELAKFAARLQRATSSKRPILLRIDRDGGHGFLAASRSQGERLLTDEYAFLWQQLDGKAP